jgi:SNF2 family DNA or RNA helicase
MGRLVTLTRDDLHLYQQHAVQYLLSKPRAFLNLGLGLGKTSATLTAISDLIDSFHVKKILVVAPLRVASKTWPDEIAKWAHFHHLTYAVLTGTAKERTAAAFTDVQVHIINIENLKWLTVLKGNNIDYDMLVIDESSMFKNRDTVRFKTARKLAIRMSRVVLMTATPAPNGYLDLWAQTYLLDGGHRLGQSFGGYKERYFKQTDRDGYKHVLKKGAAECIQHALKDIMLSMRAEDYLDMPDRFERTVEVDLDETARGAYENFEKDLVLDMGADESIEAISAAALAGKLMQFANGQVYDTERKVHTIHDAKLEALKELVEEAQEPVLVAYTFQSDRDRILAELPGAVLMGKDVSVIDKWNRGEVPVLVAHPSSAGHGLNLQHGGRHMVWYGPTYSLEGYLQMNARLYRQGQTKPVVIHHIVAKGTIDEDIMRVLQTKNATQEGLLVALRHRVHNLKITTNG